MKKQEQIDLLDARIDNLEDKIKMLSSDNASHTPNITDYAKMKMILEASGLFIGLPYNDSSDSYVGIPQDTDGHVVIIGGSGAGKSLGIAKPSLKTYKGAVCAVDIKGELSDHYVKLYDKELVARPYLIFDPSDPQSPSYDIFGWIKADAKVNTVANIREIAHSLICEDPNISDKFWPDSEREVLTAALIYYYNLGLSFSEAACLISVSSFSDLYHQISTSADRIAQMILGDIGLLKPEQQAAIGRGIRNSLSCFATDPCFGHAFRGEVEGAKCFSWADLEQYNIFLKIPEDRLDHWGSALNVMFTQLIHHLMRRPDKHTDDSRQMVPTLRLMDELASLGKLEILPHAISTLRSKNVTLCLIVQSLAQLDKVYGNYDRRIILDNCSFKAVLGANDPDTQEYLSRMAGTEKHAQYNSSEHSDAFGDSSGYSKQWSEITDWVIAPHLFASLNDIVFITPFGTKFVRKYQCHDLSDKLYSSPKERFILKVKAVNLADVTDEIISVPGTNVTITKPINHKFFTEEKIEMKTVEERVQNAIKHASDADIQRRIEESNRKKSAQSIINRRCYTIGQLVIKYFPELNDLMPGKSPEETAQNFKSLEIILKALSADRKYIMQVTEQSPLTDQMPINA